MRLTINYTLPTLNKKKHPFIAENTVNRFPEITFIGKNFLIRPAFYSYRHFEISANRGVSHNQAIQHSLPTGERIKHFVLGTAELFPLGNAFVALDDKLRYDTSYLHDSLNSKKEEGKNLHRNTKKALHAVSSQKPLAPLVPPKQKRTSTLAPKVKNILVTPKKNGFYLPSESLNEKLSELITAINPKITEIHNRRFYVSLLSKIHLIDEKSPKTSYKLQRKVDELWLKVINTRSILMEESSLETLKNIPSEFLSDDKKLLLERSINFENTLSAWVQDQSVTGDKTEAARRMQKAFYDKYTSLDLNSLNLSSLPDSILDIDSLEKLDVGNNQLSSLPENIGQLSKLKTLFLSLNHLYTLPPSIGRLSQLEHLHAINNKLTGLPEEMCNLTQLKWLLIDNNNLSSLPLNMGHLKDLQLLSFSGNGNLSELPRSLAIIYGIKNLSNQGTQIPIEAIDRILSQK